MTEVMRLVCLCVCMVLAALPCHGITLTQFRALPDNRLAIRTSFGVRTAFAVDARHVRVVLGMSVTEACRQPDAYRIVSFQDPAYAYERFVRPVRADTRTEIEAPGPAGCPFRTFERTEVTLQLPAPLKAGCAYSVIAQGVGGTMVTGAHTAHTFVYRPGAAPPAPSPAVDLAVLGLRRVEPVGPALLSLEFGPNCAPDAAGDPRHYQVRINGETVAVRRTGRISRLDTYQRQFVAIPMHQIFLELDRPFRDGDRIDVSVAPSVTLAAASASLHYRDRITLTNSIKVNQIGYLTRSPVKAAYLGRWMGSFSGEHGPALYFPEPPPFHVCDERTGQVRFTGMARLVHRSGVRDEGVYHCDHSGENVYLLDFTSFRKPGRYFISVPQVGRSLPFEISDSVYERAFRVQAYGVFAQRCGIALGPPYSPWRRIACHRRGVLPTTQSRLQEHDLRDLPRRVDYHRVVAAKPHPALVQLDRDPALVAHWPLDGDFRDASGQGHHLVPIRQGQAFSRDDRLFFGDHRVFGPTANAGPLGATAEGVPCGGAQGNTIAGWFRYEAGDNFDGMLFGFRDSRSGAPRLHVGTVWGVPRASSGHNQPVVAAERLGDGRWHHLALVATPPPSAELLLHVDGSLVGRCPSADRPGAGSFCLATLEGKEPGGKYLADWRVYARALAPPEVRALATNWREKAQVLQAYGGHHDAGDYNPRSHLDVAQTLMDAYEMAPRKFFDGQINIPERGNGIPDILDEANWALRLWVGLQDADGGVFHGTESNGDPNLIQTVELDSLGDYAYAKDAVASFTFAGAFAQAARIWRSIGKVKDATAFLARARRAYAWAVRHSPEISPHAAAALRAAHAYAAAELLNTTGEHQFRRDFAANSVWSRQPNAEVEVYQEYDQTRAAWAYARCRPEVADPALRQATRAAILRYVDMFITHNRTMGYAFLRHPWAPITWGTGAQLHWAVPATWAYFLSGDPKYRWWLIRSCDNTLGANPLGLSYIVGAGTRTARAPLHNSRYSHLGEVVPGMQVNGPFATAEGFQVRETAFPPPQTEFACLHTFADCHFAIAMDEGLVRSQAEALACFGLLLPDQPQPPLRQAPRTPSRRAGVPAAPSKGG